MFMHIVTDPSPEWIIGEDIAAGDACLVHARVPRFTAKVRPANTLEPNELTIHLDCGLCLVGLRWLGMTQPPRDAEDLLQRADRVLATWLQRQVARAARAA